MNVYFELDATLLYVLKLDGTQIYQGNHIFDWRTLLAYVDITGGTHLFDKNPTIELTTASNFVYKKTFEFNHYFPNLENVDEFQLKEALQERRTQGLAWLATKVAFVKNFTIT